ncbi:MAG: class I SAM-dependent methyltransferase [Shewanella vesiculosa]|nr:class I SAM-dependent methyltransferase [Shewanella vesiculosa]
MNESSKTLKLRGGELVERFLQGRVIDIGAGNDPICPWAEGFDVNEGDANYITKYRQVETYDAVCSSHCLEHMLRPLDALTEWWALVKPGGYLVLTVPDEDLYEQGFFPSRFNGDHKATFRLKTASSWSPVSYDVESMVASLPSAHVVSAELQCDNYDRALQFTAGRPVGRGRLLSRLYLKMEKILGYDNALVRSLRYSLFAQGVPIDQTHGDVLAQIQVVARKLPTFH